MIKRFILLLSLFNLIILKNVNAHCPLCTGAAIAGAVGARYFGLDMVIFGLFMGAFAISLGLWITKKLKSYFKYQNALIIIVTFLLTVIPMFPFIKENIYIPLFLFGDYGSLLNKIYSINRLFLGSLVGGVITLFAYYLHNYIKIRHGKVLFPYQEIVLTILLLVIVSIPIYFLLK